jgi:hypothetical protein
MCLTAGSNFDLLDKKSPNAAKDIILYNHHKVRREKDPTLLSTEDFCYRATTRSISIKKPQEGFSLASSTRC